MSKWKYFLMLTFLSVANAQTQGFVEYANCLEEDYVLVDSTSANILTQGTSYSPRCLKVKVNTSVSIFASSRHPLQAAEDFHGVVNPFRAADEHVQTQTHTLNNAGFYGYYCTHHGDASDGSGMDGMIWVLAE